jgi:uncharacterized protein (DUF1810 family)
MPLAEAPTDRFDLERFIAAQELVYTTVLDELRRGRKQTHWIWFIFPQVEGLGHSARAHHYAIRAHEEAAAYSLDDLTFCSSMTLFGAVSSRSIFQTALDRFYKGVQDGSTLAILAKWVP